MTMTRRPGSVARICRSTATPLRVAISAASFDVTSVCNVLHTPEREIKGGARRVQKLRETGR